MYVAPSSRTQRADLPFSAVHSSNRARISITECPSVSMSTDVARPLVSAQRHSHRIGMRRTIDDASASFSRWIVIIAPICRSLLDHPVFPAAAG
jgi:hypothetical protein